MGYLNAQFQLWVARSRIAESEEHKNAETAMWAWCTNLLTALGGGEELSIGNLNRLVQQARNAANRADQAASRAEEAAMKVNQMVNA